MRVALTLAKSALIAGCVLIAVAACTSRPTTPAPKQPPHPQAPVPSASASAPPPAAMAGGACLLLDYAVINAALGTDFDVAAAASKSGTYTCVVQGSAAYPDLTLSITATTLTSADFTADVKPSGAASVSKLGKTGYSSRIKAAGSAGPAIEIGWLSGNDRLIIMRYTTDPSATVSPTATAGMTKLARTVDATTV